MITKREIIASITIIAVMLIIGFIISGKISDIQLDKNAKYNKALKIESTDLFRYGMNTNVGNAFVYAKLAAVDTVTYPEIDGQYLYVKKVKEVYTMHSRVVTHSNGKSTYTTVEYYWTWDRVGKESVESEKVNFCGIEFESSKFELPDSKYYKTIKESSDVRYKYYVVSSELAGTIFTKLNNSTISDNSKFYEDQKITEVIDHLESGSVLVIFWILWIVVIAVITAGFYYLDNKWLS